MIPQSSLSSVIEHVSQPFAVSVPFATMPTAQPLAASLLPTILCAVWAIGFVTLVCSWGRGYEVFARRYVRHRPCICPSRSKR